MTKMKILELALPEIENRKKELDNALEKKKTEFVIVGERFNKQQQIIEEQNNKIELVKGEIKKFEKMMTEKKDNLSSEIEKRKEEISNLEKLYDKQEKKINEQKLQMNEIKIDIDKIAEDSIKGFIFKLNELKARIDVTEQELKDQKDENPLAIVTIESTPSSSKRHRRAEYGS